MLGVPAWKNGWTSRHGHRLTQKDGDGNWICPETKWRFREDPAGALHCLDWDEEAPVPAG
jgi:UDP-2-acetamido-3-amino-2,3-dideoxy-glucuronate N-acetyltransferase